MSAYRESHRSYHTLQHLGECLALFAEAIDLAANPGTVELALWFHDAVYAPRSGDNERRSAEWAVHELEAAGVSSDVRQRVFDLILATCHNAVPADADAQLLVDIDLAILGAPPHRFAEYDRQVREEYRWVPGFLYRIKRKQVLNAFLARAEIFNTPYFRARFEASARVNLRGAINAA